MKWALLKVGMIVFLMLDVLFMVYLMVLKFTIGLDQTQSRFFVEHWPLCVGLIICNIFLALLLRLKD